MKEDTHKIVFIVGIGRSGTTLLQSMLNAHSLVHFNKETHFIKNYIVKELSKTKYSKKAPEQLFMDVNQDPLLKDFSGRINGAIEMSLNSNNPLLTPVFFESLLRVNEAVYLGEKDPMNVHYLPQIKRAYPNSKVIHIIRDPRDVILSRINSGWSKTRSFVYHAAEYKYGFNKARADGNLNFKQHYFELKYEDLLENRALVLKDICEFLDIDFEWTMSDPEKSASSLIRNDEIKWKANVLKPVDTSNVGKWKRQLSNKQQAIVNSALNKEISSLGYDHGSQQSKGLHQLLNRVILLIIGAAFKLRYN